MSFTSSFCSFILDHEISTSTLQYHPPLLDVRSYIPSLSFTRITLIIIPSPKGIMKSAVPLPYIFDVRKSQRVAGQKPNSRQSPVEWGQTLYVPTSIHPSVCPSIHPSVPFSWPSDPFCWSLVLFNERRDG